MKRTLIIIFIIISILSSSITATSEACIPSEINFAWEAEQTILQNKIIECQQLQSAAHQMANAARALGYEENHTVILLAKQEWHEAQNIIHECKAQLDKWQTIKEKALQQFKEYPVATTIWYYLKDLGYNDYVCAGILGNIMAEVGGQTLNIQHWLGGYGYYGMCQWSRKFQSGAQG